MVQYPFPAGYSHAGVVESVGEGVTALSVGERVASFHSHRQFVGGPMESSLPVPEGVTDKEATFYALTTVVQNAIRKAEHELGDTVVVGLGILGQLVVQYARLMGAREVIAVDLSPRRLAMATTHGATAELCMGADAARESVADLTAGRLADVVYDVTGRPGAFAPARRLIRRFGRLILLGDTGTPSEQRLVNDFLWRGLRVIGAFSGDPPAEATDHHYWTRRNMARLFFDYLQRGQMHVGDLITHRFTPRDAAEVYRMLLRDRGDTVGVVFDWTQLWQPRGPVPALRGNLDLRLPDGSWEEGEPCFTSLVPPWASWSACCWRPVMPGPSRSCSMSPSGAATRAASVE